MCVHVRTQCERDREPYGRVIVIWDLICIQKNLYDLNSVSTAHKISNRWTLFITVVLLRINLILFFLLVAAVGIAALAVCVDCGEVAIRR